MKIISYLRFVFPLVLTVSVINGHEARAAFAVQPVAQCSNAVISSPTLPSPTGWTIDFDPQWGNFGPSGASALYFVADFFSLFTSVPLSPPLNINEYSKVKASISFQVLSDFDAPPEQLLVSLKLLNGAVVKSQADFSSDVNPLPRFTWNTIQLSTTAFNADRVEVTMDGEAFGVRYFSNFTSRICVTKPVRPMP